jgi:hypothetical protein
MTSIKEGPARTCSECGERLSDKEVASGTGECKECYEFLGVFGRAGQPDHYGRGVEPRPGDLYPDR